MATNLDSQQTRVTRVDAENRPSISPAPNPSSRIEYAPSISSVPPWSAAARARATTLNTRDRDHRFHLLRGQRQHVPVPLTGNKPPPSTDACHSVDNPCTPTPQRQRPPPVAPARHRERHTVGKHASSSSFLLPPLVLVLVPILFFVLVVVLPRRPLLESESASALGSVLLSSRPRLP
ncbi:hypothetical protein AB1N83_012198 [Pleurotus pulmonarius]